MNDETRQPIGRDDYLRRLEERADGGDAAAERELDRWNRMFAHRRDKPKGDAA